MKNIYTEPVEPKRLYQCPYEEACMCDMEEPCNGCETWAKSVREGRIKHNGLKLPFKKQKI